MPKPSPIPFWRGSAEERSKQVSAEEMVNWYLEPKKNPQRGEYPFVLYPTPGLKLLTTVGDGPCRGMFPMGGDLWIVSGQRIYQVTQSLTVTDRGEVAGFGDVAMTANRTHILVTTTGQHSYAVNESEIISIPESDLRGAAYQDGYGIAVKNEQFYISGIDDMTAWAALDFSSADAKPDDLVAIASVHRLLWLMGKTTVEQWVNTGNATFPFTRAQGGFMEVGCLSLQSVAVADNTIFWIGNDHVPYRAVGAQPVPLPGGQTATRMLEDSASPETARGFVYTQDGHQFYVLTVAEGTMVFDVTTGIWHNRKSYGLDRWRVSGYSWQWRKHIVGDCDNGKLYELDLDTYTENGTQIVREATSAPIGGNASRHVIHKLFVDMQAGVGLDGGVQGSDPEVMMAQSRDSGRTFGNVLARSIGKIGVYDARAQFARLGQARDRVIRLSVSDPVKAVVIGVWAELESMR